MIFLQINEPDSLKFRRLPFYLAMEEWAARRLPPAEYFFTWIVDPTVIAGRNQDVDSEVDVDYCRSRGIEIARRRSGGGTVYADRDNIMMSYVAPRVDVVETFGHYGRRVIEVLRRLGMDAEVTGRNDITVDGRKLSGTAFYHLPGRSIVHGTLLFDTNFENMINAITPSRAKLESKGVVSVESRITTVRRLLPSMTIEELNRALITGLTDSVVVLDAEAVGEIEEIEQSYYDPEWIARGRSRRTSRVEGVGEIAVTPTLDAEGRIGGFELDGDAFVVGELDEIRDRLHGAKPERDELVARLAGADLGRYIAGLTTDGFINLILKTP